MCLSSNSQEKESNQRRIFSTAPAPPPWGYYKIVGQPLVLPDHVVLDHVTQIDQIRCGSGITGHKPQSRQQRTGGQAVFL